MSREKFNRESIARVQIITAMIFFGTLGIFVKKIALPSAEIALWRGALAFIVLFLFMLLSGRLRRLASVRSKMGLLFVSGAAGSHPELYRSAGCSASLTFCVEGVGYSLSAHRRIPHPFIYSSKRNQSQTQMGSVLLGVAQDLIIFCSSFLTIFVKEIVKGTGLLTTKKLSTTPSP